MAPKNNPRFASVVRDTMERLGFTQVDVDERGGPSDTTLRKVLDGKRTDSISVRTLKMLDAAFGWEPGSAARTLAGGEPTIVDPGSAQSSPKSDSQPRQQTVADFAPLIAAIAVDAEDLQTVAGNVDVSVDVDLDQDDPDQVEVLVNQVESLIWDVESLVRDVNDFVETFEKYATTMVGQTKLQRLKNDTRRFRRQQVLLREGPGLLEYFSDSDRTIASSSKDKDAGPGDQSREVSGSSSDRDGAGADANVNQGDTDSNNTGSGEVSVSESKAESARGAARSSLRKSRDQVPNGASGPTEESRR
ncbi:hypothetical protein [Mycolicibacterium sp. A43C]